MNTGFIEILKKINLPGIVANTNKTLNLVKKTIPVYREIRPYINHEKAIFKKKDNDDTVKEIDKIKESKPIKVDRTTTYNDTLTFFK